MPTHLDHPVLRVCSGEHVLEEACHCAPQQGLVQPRHGRQQLIAHLRRGTGAARRHTLAGSIRPYTNSALYGTKRVQRKIKAAPCMARAQCLTSGSARAGEHKQEASQVGLSELGIPWNAALLLLTWVSSIAAPCRNALAATTTSTGTASCRYKQRLHSVPLQYTKQASEGTMQMACQEDLGV